MKRSKKFRIVTVITILLGSLLLAQPGGHRPPQGGPPPIPDEAQIEQMINQLSEKLSLSKEQIKEVSELYDDHFADVRKLMKKGQKAQNKKKQQMDKLKNDLDDAVKKILSKEQQIGFEEFIKDQGHGQKQGKGKPTNQLKQPR